MKKFIYRLDLNEKEFNLIKNQLDEKLISKVKQIEISEKKLYSMQRATFQRSEIARAKFFNAMFELNEKDIEVTQYTLKKHHNIPYHTSKKYFDLLNKEPEKMSDEDIEFYKDLYEDEDYIKCMNKENRVDDFMEYEQSLLEKWEQTKAKKEAKKNAK